MPVIKRYPNRKLYDTEAKQYITLESIAEMIRQGEEIRVVDNASGEDLTALTLTQIILEQEKKPGGFLPHSFLTSLIQAGGDRLNAIQRTVVSSIHFWRQIDEEIKRRIQILVSQGELTEGEGKNLLEKLMAQSLRLMEEPQTKNTEPQLSNQDIEQYLSERQIPTREDLKTLLERLDELASKLDQMNENET